MSEQFHRPVRRPHFDNLVGSADPAETARLAHSTAVALLTRTREDDTGASAERLVAFAAEHGIDEIAELWSSAAAVSLPGALWRLYLLQLAVRSDAMTVSLLYERGRVELRSIDEAVAGAPAPASPGELIALIDTILRGAFRGDFALALERAAAFCRVQAAGATHLADDYEPTEPDRSSELTARAMRLTAYAGDLVSAAGRWRRGSLD